MKAIQKVYREQMNEMRDFIGGLDWENPNFYAEWLAQTSFYSAYTTRIISKAGAQFDLDDDDLHTGFLKHTAEETGHEDIAVEDLKVMGLGIDDFAPTFATECLYRSQWYWMSRDNLAIYGYFLFLEGITVEAGPKLLKQLNGCYGADATNYVRVHVEEDTDHMKQHFNLVNSRSDKEIELIAQNLVHTKKSYKLFLDEIAERATKGTLKKVS